MVPTCKKSWKRSVPWYSSWYIPCTLLSGVVRLSLNFCTCCMGELYTATVVLYQFRHFACRNWNYFHATPTFSDVSTNLFFLTWHFFKKLIILQRTTAMDLVCTDPTQADSHTAGSTYTSNKDFAELFQPWVLGDKWQPSCLLSIPTLHNWINYRPTILHLLFEVVTYWTSS